MAINPANLEHPNKAGRVMEILNDRPDLVAALRARAGLGRDATMTPDEAVETLHLLARGAEVYGRNVGSADFLEAANAFLSDVASGLPAAVTLSNQAMARQSIAPAMNPYATPTPPDALGTRPPPQGDGK